MLKYYEIWGVRGDFFLVWFAVIRWFGDGICWNFEMILSFKNSADVHFLVREWAKAH